MEIVYFFQRRGLVPIQFYTIVYKNKGIPRTFQISDTSEETFCQFRSNERKNVPQT